MRADANSKLGSGHVMRCLSIAKALRKRGQETTFITADKEAATLILDQEFLSICLNSTYDNLEEEIEKLKSLVIGEDIQMLLIDSYYVTLNYLEEINKLTRVIYMDDLNLFIYPVEILINYNIYAERDTPKEKYPNSTKLLLGCNYVPLRDEFICEKLEIQKTAKNVLITTGGADSYNMAGQIIKYIRNDQRLNFLRLHVVIGPLNNNLQSLNEISKQFNDVILHFNVSNMSQRMRESDIAISAGGSTLYELCSCGVPTISFSYADNQREGTKEFDRQGFIYYAGDSRDDVTQCLKNIGDKLLEFCEDDLLRKGLSLRMQALVDGFGSDRIVEKILII